MPKARASKLQSANGVPNVGHPDRKRVLNVLAQRRYRQRRRDKIVALEAQARGQTTASTQSLPQNSEEEVQFDTEDETRACPLSAMDELGVVEEIARMPPDDSSSFFTLDSSSFSLQLMQDFNENFSSLPSPIPSPPSSASTPPSISPRLSSDDGILGIPILNALQAFIKIASAMDVGSDLWNPFYLHVLPRSVPALTALPANLHPIPAQHTIPHHPLLDLLPWPSVREKLICILSLPSSFRPPIAQEDSRDQDYPSPPQAAPTLGLDSSSSEIGMRQSTAIVQLVQDLDDLQDGGGMRVHGNMTAWNQGNELVEEAWEVGSVFYSNWWWCLDQKIIETSNKRRRERGLGRLKVAG